MLDLSSHALVRRISGNAPGLVSLTLGTLIAVELMQISIALFGGGPHKTLEPTRVLSARTVTRPVVDVHNIIAAHLFGVFTEDQNAQNPDQAPRTTANLLLAGTIATEEPKTGLAIISDEGPAKVYKVGQSVGGALLHSVYLDHVILSRNGKLETLVLPRLLLAKGRTITQAAPVLRTADLEQPAMLEAAPVRTAGDVVRTVASSGADGNLRGFRVFPNGNRDAFDKSGLRGGDLVVAVNGTTLQGQGRQADRDILNTLKTSSQATVTVERDGQRREVTINATQSEE